MSFSASIMARFGLDTSAIKAGLNDATNAVQKATQQQSGHFNAFGNVALNSTAKVKRAVKSLGEDILAGVSPTQILISALGKLGMVFKTGAGLGIGAMVVAMFGKSCLDSAQKADELSKAVQKIGEADAMPKEWTSLEQLNGLLDQAIQKQKELKAETSSPVTRFQNSVSDVITGGNPNATWGQMARNFGLQMIAGFGNFKFPGVKRGSNKTNERLEDEVLNTAFYNKDFQQRTAEKSEDEATRQSNSVGKKIANFETGNARQSELDAVDEKSDERQRKLLEAKGVVQANDKLSLDVKNRMLAALDSEIESEKKLAVLEKDKIHEKFDFAKEDLELRRAILKAGDNQVAKINEEIAALERRKKEVGAGLQDQVQLQIEEKQAERKRVEDARDREVASARITTQIMQAQLGGHLAIAQELAIEEKYRDRINQALRTGNTELANQLLTQQQLAISAQAFENWKQTPEERQARRQQERKNARDDENFKAEKGRVARDMDNGIAVGDTGRRGDAKRAVEGERKAARKKQLDEINKGQAELGQPPITEDQLPDDTKTHWWEQSHEWGGPNWGKSTWKGPDWGNTGDVAKKINSAKSGTGDSSKQDNQSPMQVAQVVVGLLKSIDTNVGINK